MYRMAAKSPMAGIETSEEFEPRVSEKSFREEFSGEQFLVEEALGGLKRRTKAK